MGITGTTLEGVRARRPLPGAAVALTVAATALGAWFLFREVPRFGSWDPAHYGRYWGVRGWIALHVLGGLVAIACGPFQLWSGFRGHTAAAHRLRGRIYALGVLAGSIGGVWIALTSPAFPALAPPLIMLAAAWLATTGLAVAAIRRGHVERHRDLMIRSYVVTFAFVFFRWFAELPILTSLSPPERYATIGWLCWTLPLLVTEVVVQGRRMSGTAWP